jgi:predicted nucleic acid-binding protein
VTDSGRLLVLDTNVLVHLARGKAAGRKLDNDYNLSTASYRPAVCVVTVGECMSIARYNNWGAKKKDLLSDLFRQLVVADISDYVVLEAYAEIDAWCRRAGRSMAKNDLWIAAVVRSQQGWLLTCDGDFCQLHPHLIEVEFVDPATLPSGP